MEKPSPRGCAQALSAAPACDPRTGDAQDRPAPRLAAELGNTPAVARASYVDPRVVAAYQDGLTIAPAIKRAQRHCWSSVRQELIEKATCRLIHRVEKGR